MKEGPDLHIPVMKPKLPSLSEVSDYFSEIDLNRQFTNGGPMIRRLERAYSKLLNVPQELVVATSSGTMAIEALAVSKSPQLEVFEIPNYTFAATAFATQRSGIPIRFIDTKPAGAVALSPRHLGESRVGLVMVAPFGELMDLESALHKKLGNIIFDFAAALLNVIQRQVPILGNSVAFSLHATKPLGCGEGGLVVARDEEEARFVRRYINFGFSTARDSIQPGTNGKMSEHTAAIALSAVERIDEEIREWTDVRRRTAALRLPDIVQNLTDRASLTPYWIVRFESMVARDRFEKVLTSKGIESRRWWPRLLSEMRPFVDCESKNSPNSRLNADTNLGLPFYRDLSIDQVDYIGAVLRESSL